MKEREEKKRTQLKKRNQPIPKYFRLQRTTEEFDGFERLKYKIYRVCGHSSLEPTKESTVIYSIITTLLVLDGNDEATADAMIPCHRSIIIYFGPNFLISKFRKTT